MFNKMMDAIRGKDKKIVFTEGTDPRIQKAAQQLVQDGLITPIMLGNLDAIKAQAEKDGINLDGMELIDPKNYDDFDTMVERMVEIRKGKQDEDACTDCLKNENYFGTMLVEMGLADGLLGGATYSTADTVRPALQIIGTRPGCKIVSSCFIMSREDANGEPELYAMADCAINLFPDREQIASIAQETAAASRLFGIDPVVALLSYSTLGSGKGDSVDKMAGATADLKAMDLDFPVDGEFQFDTAISPEVAKTKAPESTVAGKANTFIFPDINAANIGYKMAQRLGGFDAFGPILLGLNAPVNDLSRGTVVDEVYKMAIITAASQ